MKVLSLIFPVIPRAEPCCAALTSVVGWTGAISPCFSSAQLSLMRSTRLAHHWQCTCLAPGTPGGPWKDPTALQHTQIPGLCPPFVGRTNGDTFAAQSETIPRLFEQLLAMDVEMIRMSGSLWKGTGLPGRWPTRSCCKDGFHMTSELCMVHAHTHSGWERGAQEWLTLGRKRASLSLSPLFTAMCLLFPTFLHVIWNKKFGQSESQKGLYFSTYSTKFKRILCWGRVAILCLQWWNWHLQIKINYVQ